MKTTCLFPTILFLSLLLLVIGCGASSGGSETDSSSEESRVTGKGSVQFKLDGADWISSAEHPDNRFDVAALTDHETMVRVEAFAANGSYITLNVYKESGISTGTYPITDPGMRGFFKYNINGGGGFLTNGMPDNPGEITITSLTREKVTGTFQFQLRDSGDPNKLLKVTEGRFDVGL